ncbi:MAG: hypothetical protein KUG77_12940, partial [Nannocystaceae bacterium]|nr:hypothetical protein [Nannocystaceae bacterium]
PLPGDAVEVEAWVVAAEREVPTDDIDPTWFLCPRSQGCVSTLGLPTAARPCVGVVPEDVACRLSDGARPYFVVPPLDTQTPLEDQASFRIAMVGHIDEQLTTADCVELVSDPSTADWSGCLVGYRRISLGPTLRLVTHAIEEGIEVPPGFDLIRDEPVRPPFNPEIIPLTVFPYYDTGRLDLSRPITVAPGETAVLEPGAVYVSSFAWDPRDRQQVAEFGPLGLSIEPSIPSRSLFTTAPGVLEFSMTPGWQIWAPQEPSSFELRVVISDRAGGAAWTTFNFEVSP